MLLKATAVAVLVALVALAGQLPVDASSHSVTGISVARSGARQAVATVNVSGAGTYYVRYALTGTTNWNQAGQATAGTSDTSVAVTLHGLTSGGEYDVQASADQRFPDSATESISYAQDGRPSHLDLTLASGHNTPRGLWANADTFWIINDGSNPDNDILAYKRTPEGDFGTRDSDKDIDLDASGNRDAKGLWSDGTTMFVVDQSDEQVYAYQLSDGTRDTTREFNLDSGHDRAEGIWANADTFWVVNNESGVQNRLVMAYKRTPASEYGDRDSAKDIPLQDAGNNAPRGIWSDGETVWVADDSDVHVYAYWLSSGERNEAKDVDLFEGFPHPHVNPAGVWGAGDIIWVGRNSSTKQVYAYYLPGAGIDPPEVTAIAVSSTSATSIRATVTVTEAGRYYLRVSEEGKELWQVTSAVTAGAPGDITFNVTGMQFRGPAHVVEVSKDADFDSGVEQASFVHRPAHLDMDLASEHTEPRGSWGNANTIWVLNDGSDPNNDILAYKRTPEGDFGTRDSSKDIDLDASGNHSGKGVWSDGTTMFVVDESDEKVYAYHLSTGARDEASEFDLDPANDDGWGIWGNTDTFWVANDGSDEENKILAYKRTPETEYGERDSAKDIPLNAAGNQDARGIWSDGETMWVVDDDDDRLYAYHLASGGRLPSSDVVLLDEADGGPRGLWGEEGTLWVAHDDGGTSKGYGYYPPQLGSRVSLISLRTATATSATVRTTMSSPERGSMVYLRFRSLFEDEWSTIHSMPAATTVDFALSGLPTGRQVVIQASLDSALSDGSELTTVLSLRPLQRDFPLRDGGKVRGLWSDGTTLWAVVDGSSERVDAYTLATGAVNSARSFTLDDENSTPRGLHADGGTMWVVDRNDTVYAYTMTAGSSFGDLDSTKTFTIEPTNGHPAGAWSDGTTMWIVGHVREHLYAYNVGTTGTFGDRVEDKEGALASVYGKPRGTWSDGSTLWVADASEDRIHAYELGAAGLGERQSSREVMLLPEHDDPWGIVTADGIMWVADNNTGRARAYFLPGSPTGNITAVHYDEIAREEADITVTIANPDSTSQTVTLEYARLPDGAPTTVSTTTSSTTAAFSLSNLTGSARYAVQVSLGTSAPLPIGGFKTKSHSQTIGKFLKTTTVESFEDNWPWLREAYDRMRRLNVPVWRSSHANVAPVACLLNHPASCRSSGIGILRISTTNRHSYTHELAHVYTIDSGIADAHQPFIGYGWLYFLDLTSGQGSNCKPEEVYAEGLAYSVRPGTQGSIYYNACSALGSRPSDADIVVATNIVGFEIPDWLATEYGAMDLPYDTSSSPDYDNMYDLEAMWTDVQAYDGNFGVPIFVSLGHAFGGYCHTNRAHRSAFGSGTMRNPWKLGGCVPQAPAVTLTSEGLVSWTTPAYDGGDDITSYRVQWRADGQSFSSSRSAMVTDLATTSYSTPATEPGSVVRVTAVNSNGDGAAGEVAQAPRAPSAPPTPTSIGEDQGLLVSWSAPARTGGEVITRYDLRSIRTDAMDKSDDEWDLVEGAWRTDGGDLEASISGLTNSVSYDVQVRAVNSVDAGPWSATHIGTPASADATLSGLSLSEGRLSPDFESDVETYTATVGNSVTRITVTAALNEANATVSITPTDASREDGHQVNLSVGSGKAITVTVTAANRVTTKAYSVTVTRVGPDTGLSPRANDPAAPFPSEAVYTVTFTGDWTTAATPDGLPTGAHFSRLVGSVHSAGVTFLKSGATASAGVESMAEVGQVATLKGEVQTAIDAATARSILEGSTDSGGATATQTLTATLDTTQPRVTLVTMIAPSPDWFVGVSGLPLLNSRGRWLRSHSVNLYPWDAGTKDGTGFALGGVDTDPQGNITSIRGTGKFSTEAIATLSFALQSVSTTREIAENTPANRNIGRPVTATATESAVTYTLGGTDAASFSIVASSGQLQTKAALNREVQDSYEVDVTATDGNGSSVTTVTINVADVDEPPDILGTQTYTITENSAKFVGRYTASDPEGSATTWLALTGADAAHFRFDTSTGELSFAETPDFDRATNGNHGPVYRVTLRASDGTQSVRGTRDVVITVTDVNDPPVVSGVSAVTVPENNTAVASYRAADPERATTTFAWSLAGDDASAFAISSSGVLTFDSAPDYERPTDSGGNNIYEVTIRATDESATEPGARTGEMDVAVTVGAVDEPPVVQGLDEFTMAEEDAVVVGSYTFIDPEGSATTAWDTLGGNDAGFFQLNTTTGQLSFNHAPDFDAKADHNKDNKYEVTLRASDGTQNVRGTLGVVVTVTNVAEAPVITGPESVTDFLENSDTTSVIARYSAQDPEGQGVSWSALSGDDAGKFTLDSDGDLTFRTSPNFEDQSRYEVTINAFDGALTGSYPVVVTLKDVNEAPVITSGPVKANFEENATGTVATYSATDPDAGATLTWSLGGADSTAFTITDGEVEFVRPPDYDTKPKYNVIVRVSDGTNTVTRDLEVTIRDVNEPPVVTGDFMPTVNENSSGSVTTYTARDPDAGATLEWSLLGTDAADFEISAAGALSFENPPDHEAQASHVVTVRASDGTNNVDNLVTVTVTDVNEIEKLAIPTTPRIGIAFTATLSEGDDVQSTTWAWSRSTTGTSGWTAIDGETSSTYTPAGGDRDYYLRVTASYNDGHDDRTLHAISTNKTVPERTTNQAPVFPNPLFQGGVTGLSVNENVSGGALVGTVPQATDEEGDDLTYSMAVSGFTTNPPFEIDSGTRRITVAGGATLNHETRETYSVTVTATDEFDATDDATFNITINDVNEAPTAVADRPSTNEGDAVTFDVLENDNDPDDGDTLTVRIASSPASGRGSVTVNSVTQEITYTPPNSDFNSDVNGDVTFTYAVSDGSLSAMATVTVTVDAVNDAPVFTESSPSRSIREGAREGDDVGNPVAASDVDGDVPEYRISGHSDFVIDDATGQISVAPNVTIDRERVASYTMMVTADDGEGETSTVTVTITVTNVNEAPTAGNDVETVDEDDSVTIAVLDNDSDPDGDALTVRLDAAPSNGRATVEGDGTITYTPNADFDRTDTFTYTASDGQLQDDASVTVTVNPVNDAPVFASATAERRVAESAEEGDAVGEPVTATDVDTNDTLSYSLSGTDAAAFDIDSDGQITVASGTTFDVGTQPEYTVMVEARDGDGATATIDVTITVTAGPVTPPIIGGGLIGGGGGGPSGPVSSDIEFEWNVTRDIEQLDSGHEKPSGSWSDGTTLWLLQNGSGADDAVYAYDLATGERVTDREFDLDDTNRAPRGVWSNRTTVWVSDSGQDKLFAHDIATGERTPARDLALDDRNADPRGIWSDGEVMWVLDGGKNALFGYDLASGELLGECALDTANGDPRGLWSDGVTVWVSDHAAKRLFAYRLPQRGALGTEDKALERIRAEEFAGLSGAGNNSPRGLWSDGAVMYVADESDGRVYTYNMPDAIDARLASLVIEGVDFGEFDPARSEYVGTAGPDITVTTVAAEAVQRGATLVIEPPDADEAVDGHQVALEDLDEITVTVTSEDGTRERVYRVALQEMEQEATPEAWAHCLKGAVAEGFSLLVYEGGTVDELVACAGSRSVDAVYALSGGAPVSYIREAPAFVNRQFRERFADGVPALTPLIVASQGPASADPVVSAEAGLPWTECLRGSIAGGFSAVVYEGGSVADLEACVDGRAITSVYVLKDGGWASLILGAPDFVNRAFHELFADGVPAVTPLVVRSDGPPPVTAVGAGGGN